MVRFNLDDYETVEQRIARFYRDNPDGRIVTSDCTTDADRERKTWRVKGSIFLSAEDQKLELVKATGYAFEVDGTQGANQTAALENAETSAIGRALANAGYSGNKRTTREEMEKVSRGVGPASMPVPDGFLDRLDAAVSIEELQTLWNEAGQGGFVTPEVTALKDRVKARLAS